jgi:ribonuclease P protein component
MSPHPDASQGPQPPDERLGRRQRLIQPRLFDEAYGQGRKFVGRHMVMFLRSGEGAALRFGVVTGRKIGPAVTRNRARRRIRDVFRRHRAQLRGDFDVVFLARAGVARADWAEVVKDFLGLARRAGLLKE